MIPTSSSQDWMKISFVISDDTSSHDMLATLRCGDDIIGRFRMDWSHWPLDDKMMNHITFNRVIDLLREFGRLIIKQQQVEAQNE
jgi:hypothetical protein